MKPSLYGMIDKLSVCVQQEIDQAVLNERHLIASYIQHRALEIGSGAYQLAEDIELGLHEEE